MATVFRRRGRFRLPWQFLAAALACVVGGLGLYRTLSHSQVWQPFSPYAFVRATSHEPHIAPVLQPQPLQSPVSAAAEPESDTVGGSALGDALVVRVPNASAQRDEPAPVASPAPDAPLPALDPPTPDDDPRVQDPDVAVSAASQPVRPVETGADGTAVSPARPPSDEGSAPTADPDSPTPFPEPSLAPADGPGKSEAAPGQNKANDKKPPKPASKPKDEEPKAVVRGATDRD